ncbi:MAG: hypothetical protein JO287_18790 [Pseudonocardiales bacterium]|nr:hypothetical protein [Pseudonocardiales bacterium]
MGELRFSQQPALPERGIEQGHWQADAVVHPLIERGVPQVGEPFQQSAPHLDGDVRVTGWTEHVGAE